MEPTREDLLRGLETGLPEDYELLHAMEKPTKRFYSKVVTVCKDCHCCCPGTMFRPSTCARTGKEVAEMEAPPSSCPLPLAV